MHLRSVNKALLLLSCSLLVSCETRTDVAPVVGSHWRAPNQQVMRHVVTRGETLYAIAFRYDQDYRQLARINHLGSNYIVHVGQVLRLYSPVRHSVQMNSPTIVRSTLPPMNRTYYLLKQQSQGFMSRGLRKGWLWPVAGRLIHPFNPQQGRKGIDIGGKQGTLIRASANGVIAYAGNGLPSYGNLIIIKHSNQYMTAYGNNAHNRVREGQSVRAGQVIADMGLLDHRYWGVHFEIRQQGKPVNPLHYLSSQ